MYLELPGSAASLTSLLGLILVTELTRGGAAQLNALNRHDNPMPRMHTHLAGSNETDPRKLFALNPHNHQHVHGENEILLHVMQDWGYAGGVFIFQQCTTYLQ